MESEKQLIYLDDVNAPLRLLSNDLTCPIHIAAEIDQILEQAVPVDAVKVVRCKKCTYWKRHTKVDKFYGACSLYRITKHENGYCDKGLRRENEL